MIKSFACRETQRIWEGEPSRRCPSAIQDVARRKLRMLDAAPSLASLRVPPGNRLEALSGDRKGQNSIRINNQWRICFMAPRRDEWNSAEDSGLIG
jgi:proteic killer suppression protein